MFHWIVLATSWNILSGYTGYFSFGHGAFFGVGIYTSATLMARFDWPFLYTLPAAALLACVLGVALGAVVFRVKGIRGEVFALLTLAVTFVIGTIIVNTPIDGQLYHKLAITITYDGPWGLEDAPGGGLVGRVVWHPSSGAPYQVSDDLVLRTGRAVYFVDLKTWPPTRILDPAGNILSVLQDNT